MAYVIAAIALLAALWFARKWFRLVWFRAATLRVITQDLAYNPAVPGVQGEAFNTVTRQFCSAGAPVEDAAIAFMLVQLGALSEPLDERSRSFAMEKLARIKGIVARSVSGSAMVRDFLESKQWHRS